jgi:hypothetical protein
MQGRLLAVTLAFVSGCGSGLDSHIASSSSALTDAQCIFFETNGTDTICHATGSSKHPYVLLRFSEAACINNHAGHAHDFIDFAGGDCNNAACLPVGAPCDATLGCCSGACNNAVCSCSEAGGGCATDSDCCPAAGNGAASCNSEGICVQLCPAGFGDCDGNAANGCETNLNSIANCGACGVACAPTNASGDCSTGTCQIASCNPGYEGTNCQTVNPCAPTNPCQNGGTCNDNGDGTYTCTCATGYQGTNCQTVVSTCGDGICQAGEGGTCPQDCCGDGICEPGETAANCPADCP